MVPVGATDTDQMTPRYIIGLCLATFLAAATTAHAFVDIFGSTGYRATGGTPVPTCNAATNNQYVTVLDQTTQCTGSYTSGGTVKCLARCDNGIGWNIIGSASSGSTLQPFVYPQTFGAVPDAKVYYDGTIANASSVLMAEGATTVSGNQTLPEATVTVASSAITQWNIPGTITIGSNTVTCTGTNVNNQYFTTFTGCTGGSGSIASGATVSQLHSVFASGDVGKLICVSSISGTYGPNNSASAISVMPQSELCGTIGTFTSASQVTLTGITSAHGSVMHGATYRFGTDNKTALQNTLNSCGANGCTVLVNGSFGSSDGLTVPIGSPISFLGTTSYQPDVNYNEGHFYQGSPAGFWFITKSMTKAGINYGTSTHTVQQIPQDVRNLGLVAGSGPGLCPGGIGNGCFANGFFGTLDGGGADGIDITNMQHVRLYGLTISNFSGDCWATKGSVTEYNSIDHSYIGYCGGNGINFSNGPYNGSNTVMVSEIEDNGLSGLLWNSNTLSNGEDTLIVIGNTISADDVLALGNFDINLVHGRDAVIFGNLIEPGSGGGPGSGYCHNGTGNDAQGNASQIWAGNSGFDFSACETIQQKIDEPLLTCSSTTAGAENWVKDGSGTAASPTCTYGGTYSSGAGTGVCKVGCDGTHWRYGY